MVNHHEAIYKKEMLTRVPWISMENVKDEENMSENDCLRGESLPQDVSYT